MSNITDLCLSYETELMSVGNPLIGVKIKNQQDIDELRAAKIIPGDKKQRDMFKILDNRSVRLAGLTFPVPITNSIAYIWLQQQDRGVNKNRTSSSGYFCRAEFLSEPSSDNDYQCEVKYFKTGVGSADETGSISPVFDDLVYAVSFATAESLEGFERKNLVEQRFVDEVRSFGTTVTACNSAQRKRQELIHPVIMNLPADHKFKIFCDACSLEPDFTADQLIRQATSYVLSEYVN